MSTKTPNSQELYAKANAEYVDRMLAGEPDFEVVELKERTADEKISWLIVQVAILAIAKNKLERRVECLEIENHDQAEWAEMANQRMNELDRAIRSVAKAAGLKPVPMPEEPEAA